MATLHGKSIVVVGSGFGGLAAACLLAQSGARVRVLEKNEQLGGRASVLEADGFRFDMGPSWYLMPDVYARFFGAVGRRPEQLYDLTRLDPHYRIFFKDGMRLDIPPDRDKVRALFESVEAGAGDALDRYLANSERNYDIGMREFVYRDRASVRDYLSPGMLRHARALTLFGSMEQHVDKYFRDPKLRQIMQYTLVFLGGSPHNTPALYNLMGHVDFNLGVFYPAGGMGSVVNAMVSGAHDLGVATETDSEVTAIEPVPGGFVVHAGEVTFTADLVLSNADYAHTEGQLLQPLHRQFSESYWERRTYAPSAYLLYLGVRGAVPELAHHNLVLPVDWDPHFRQIFDAPAWPDDPSYYVCVTSASDDTVAPAGHSNLFLLVPIAAGLSDTPEERRRQREVVLGDLAAHTGTDLADRIVFERSFCVSDFRDRYHSAKGTALGLAHTLRQTSLLRPPHRSRKVPGLYYVGANTTPGIGVPMCLISGEITAALIERDHGS